MSQCTRSNIAREVDTLTGKSNLFCLARGQIVQMLSLESQEITEFFEANNFIREEGKWPNLKCQRSVSTFLTEAEKLEKGTD
jgi:hypothetical protein